MKQILLTVAAACSIFLSGCGDDKLVEEATKVDASNENQEKVTAIREEQKLDEQQKFYSSITKPIDEVLEESKYEKKSILTQKIVKRESYKDSNEFAAYSASVLADFYNGNIKPSEYYAFLKTYASKEVLTNVPNNKEEGTEVLSFVQESILESNKRYSDYVLSEVTLNPTKDEGYFYRKVITQNDYSYFRTTIIKENNVWKFSADEPSAPFEEIPKTNGKDERNENN